MKIHCPDCGTEMVLMKMPNGDDYYGCTHSENGIRCRGNVSCHPGTTNPMGIPATEDVRRLRTECHKGFDRLWKYGYYTRTGAYVWLARWMGIPEYKAHIGSFDKEQCLRLLKILEGFKGTLLMRPKPKRIKKKEVYRGNKRHH